MPGVNLDFFLASKPPEAVGSPHDACAESDLENVFGDLLAEEKSEDEEEQFCKRELEVTLQCAVGEIHCDLRAFGKRVDARLKEAAAQVAPLAEALVRLQEESTRLRIQQERLLRQVEMLCEAKGLPGPVLHELPSKEILTSFLCEAKTASGDFPTSSSFSPACTPQDTDSTDKNPDCPLSQDAPANTEGHTPPTNSFPLASASTGTSTRQTLEPSPEPHPPAFATRRSLSAPSLMANISSSNEVLQSVNS